MVTKVMTIDQAWQSVLNVAASTGAQALQNTEVKNILDFIMHETVITTNKAPIAEIINWFDKDFIDQSIFVWHVIYGVMRHADLCVRFYLLDNFITSAIRLH